MDDSAATKHHGPAGVTARGSWVVSVLLERQTPRSYAWREGIAVTVPQCSKKLELLVAIRLSKCCLPVLSPEGGGGWDGVGSGEGLPKFKIRRSFFRQAATTMYGAVRPWVQKVCFTQ